MRKTLLTSVHVRDIVRSSRSFVFWLLTHMANERLVDTKLADAYAQLYTRHAALELVERATDTPKRPPAQRSSTSSSRIPPSILGGRSPRPTTPIADTSSTTRLRSDLAAAHVRTEEATVQLTALRASYDRLVASNKSAIAETATLRKQVAGLVAEKATIERRLRDRESELREGRKLVENVQDEMVGLEMQLNVKEERVGALEKENKELVDRWMRRVGEDAKNLNMGSGWQ